jgi:hypothetical protein
VRRKKRGKGGGEDNFDKQHHAHPPPSRVSQHIVSPSPCLSESHFTFALNAQTRSPTQAPTRSCFPGEYRPSPTSACAFCAPGTYWNQTYETTACLDCPDGQTSLQGAVQCYEPCPPNTALNTTDLTCVPLPASLTDALAAANLTIDFNTTEVFLVEEPLKLEGTLGAAAAGNQTVIVTLSPDAVYPQTQSYVFTSNVILLGQTSSGGRRRRQLQATVRGVCVCWGGEGGGGDVGVGVFTCVTRSTSPFYELTPPPPSSTLFWQDTNPVIRAVSGNRHLIMGGGASILTEGVTFVGSPLELSAGGIELQDQAQGYFFDTTFLDCHWLGNGGALSITDGSSAEFGT